MIKQRMLSVAGTVLLVAALGAAAAAGGRATDWAFQIAVIIPLAISWNIMGGAGLLSLGQSAFWGVGYFASAIISHASFGSFTASLLVALFAGMFAGTVLALLTGRLRGVFFAISTLALSEGLRVVATMMPDLTGGAAGIYVENAVGPAPWVIVATAVGFAGLSVLVSLALSWSPLQLAMRAMRNNEHASQMLGINPLFYRTLVSGLCGSMAAIAGCLGGWRGGYVTPEIAFDLNYAILAQIAPILGGIYTVPGPILGSIAVVILSEMTRLLLAQEGYGLLIYGLVLAVAIKYMPHGLYALFVRPSQSVPPASPAVALPAVAPDDARRDVGGREAAPELEVRGLSAGYGEAEVLREVSFKLERGEVVCLLGPNGAGKTTLTRALMGLLPSGGEVLFRGAPLTGAPPHVRVGKGLALVPEGRQVFPNLTVEDNLLLGAYVERARRNRAAKLEEVYSLFPKLSERRHQQAGLMSGGEQQMLALGRAMMSEPKLLILDEPSLGLAPKVIITVFDAVKKIAATGISILIVEQNAFAALSVAHRFYVLGHGRIARSGQKADIEDILNDPNSLIGLSETANTASAKGARVA
ncbi:ATP-binding cassette domain-containing protein [Bradyrhizobium sp. 31Argb]|uniref:ATP-binding cassette domain-containing protein n=1 Tax=Bradyrhizobium sp. 31Argb TaxID=3141247 RepID=UPI003749D78C